MNAKWFFESISEDIILAHYHLPYHIDELTQFLSEW